MNIELSTYTCGAKINKAWFYCFHIKLITASKNSNYLQLGDYKFLSSILVHLTITFLKSGTPHPQLFKSEIDKRSIKIMIKYLLKHLGNSFFV